VSFGEILGLVAGAITTGSFVPQVVRVFRIRSAHEISLVFILAFVVGDSAWLVYGVYFRLFPVVFWNVLAILLAVALLIGKIRYGKHPYDPQVTEISSKPDHGVQEKTSTCK
jgi:MtN3 and saliva related transmembrane protein